MLQSFYTEPQRNSLIWTYHFFQITRSLLLQVVHCEKVNPSGCHPEKSSNFDVSGNHHEYQKSFFNRSLKSKYLAVKVNISIRDLLIGRYNLIIIILKCEYLYSIQFLIFRSVNVYSVDEFGHRQITQVACQTVAESFLSFTAAKIMRLL